MGLTRAYPTTKDFSLERPEAIVYTFLCRDDDRDGRRENGLPSGRLVSRRE